MSTKKKPSGRRSVQAKAKTASDSKDTVGPRSTAEKLSALIAKYAPAHLQLVSAVRRSLRKRLPTANEVVYEYRAWIVISYSPSEHGYEGVLAIRADADGVKLYFNRGKELPDPEKLLRGSGGQMRSIDVAGMSTLARPAVARLIDEAIARNPAPFATAGHGAVVLRSESAKQRPRGKTRKLSPSPK